LPTGHVHFGRYRAPKNKATSAKAAIVAANARLATFGPGERRDHADPDHGQSVSGETANQIARYDFGAAVFRRVTKKGEQLVLFIPADRHVST
jgi:hypothetical protein